MHTLKLDPQDCFTVVVVGAGGNGSAIFLALPYLHQAMVAWGHRGLDVYLMDGDTVSETNCIRQPFAISDVGQNKATVLVNRVNLFWGLDWKAIPFNLEQEIPVNGLIDLVIGCVDSRASRRVIQAAVTAKDARIAYWLDLGNAASHGQFVLGQPSNFTHRKTANRLPTAAELYPEIVDVFEGEDDLPSCSAIEALQRQEPFINQTLAMQSLAMLTQLLRYGQTSYHGAFYNAKTGVTQPIPVPAPTAVLNRNRKPRKAQQ